MTTDWIARAANAALALGLAACVTDGAAPGLGVAQPSMAELRAASAAVGDGALPARITSGEAAAVPESTEAPPPARIVAAPEPAGPAAASDEAQIAALINAWRASHGLAAVPVSPALTEVARAHARDLAQNRPNRGDCTLHSWSDAGDWTPVCYTADDAQAEAMWSKPAELTGAAYPHRGFEIAYHALFRAAPDAAMTAWKDSPRHNNVLLQQGRWADTRWRAMGVGVAGGYAVVWFGRREDPQAG